MKFIATLIYITFLLLTFFSYANNSTDYKKAEMEYELNDNSTSYNAVFKVQTSSNNYFKDRKEFYPEFKAMLASETTHYSLKKQKELYDHQAYLSSIFSPAPKWGTFEYAVKEFYRLGFKLDESFLTDQEKNNFFWKIMNGDAVDNDTKLNQIALSYIELYSMVCPNITKKDFTDIQINTTITSIIETRNLFYGFKTSPDKIVNQVDKLETIWVKNRFADIYKNKFNELQSKNQLLSTLNFTDYLMEFRTIISFLLKSECNGSAVEQFEENLYRALMAKPSLQNLNVEIDKPTLYYVKNEEHIENDITEYFYTAPNESYSWSPDLQQYITRAHDIYGVSDYRDDRVRGFPHYYYPRSVSISMHYDTKVKNRLTRIKLYNIAKLVDLFLNIQYKFDWLNKNEKKSIKVKSSHIKYALAQIKKKELFSQKVDSFENNSLADFYVLYCDYSGFEKFYWYKRKPTIEQWRELGIGNSPGYEFVDYLNVVINDPVESCKPTIER